MVLHVDRDVKLLRNQLQTSLEDDENTKELIDKCVMMCFEFFQIEFARGNHGDDGRDIDERFAHTFVHTLIKLVHTMVCICGEFKCATTFMFTHIFRHN